MALTTRQVLTELKMAGLTPSKTKRKPIAPNNSPIKPDEAATVYDFGLTVKFTGTNDDHMDVDDEKENRKPKSTRQLDFNAPKTSPIVGPMTMHQPLLPLLPALRLGAAVMVATGEATMDCSDSGPSQMNGM